MSATTALKVKSYCDDFTIQLGPMETSGRLLPIHNSAPTKEVQFLSVSPEGQKVSQRYIDDDGNLFLPKELKKGVKNEAGNIVIVDPETVKKAKQSPLPKNVVNLTVHYEDECWDKMFPAKSQVVYLFDPNTEHPAHGPKWRKWHDMFVAILADTNKTFIGYCNLQNNEGLFRVLNWRGHLLIQKQTPPAELFEYDDVESSVSPEEIAGVTKLIEKLASPFDAADYADQTKARITNLQEAVVDGADLGEIISPVASEFDILSALDDFDLS